MTARMVSYAQNGEDVVLARAFADQERGFYVDIGAFDPVRDSVTHHFYEQGWHGVNVEPQSGSLASLVRARPRDTNVHAAVGSAPGTMTLHSVTAEGAMSTLDEGHADTLRAAGFEVGVEQVPVLTLGELLAEHASDRVIDFLKVDVEGFEQHVLGGVDWERWRPRVLVVEGTLAPAPWERRLVTYGYARSQWDGINLFFVRAEDRRLLGPRLVAPATIALDRYDPWMYVQQLRDQADQLLALREQHIGAALARIAERTGQPGDEAHALGSALGRLMHVRGDLMAHFGVPPRTDVAGLLRWSATTLDADDDTGRALRPHVHTISSLLAAIDLPAQGAAGATAH